LTPPSMAAIISFSAFSMSMLPLFLEKRIHPYPRTDSSVPYLSFLYFISFHLGPFVIGGGLLGVLMSVFYKAHLILTYSDFFHNISFPNRQYNY